MICLLCLYLVEPERQREARAIVGGHGVCLEHVHVIVVSGVDRRTWLALLVIAGMSAAEAGRARPWGPPGVRL